MKTPISVMPHVHFGPTKAGNEVRCFPWNTQKSSGIFMGFSPKLRLYEIVSHPQALVRAFFSSIYWVVI